MKSKIKGLYAIVDNTTVPHRSHLNLAKDYLKGGAKILQLRMKGFDENHVLEVAKKIIALKSQYEFCFIVNDFLSIAKELGTDGYHGGANDAPIKEARAILGDKKIIGHSSHSLDQAVRAEEEGADYVALGAIYPSPSKGHAHPVQGIDKLEGLVKRLKVPVVAIGGISRDNVEKVLATGAASIAMIQALAGVGETVNETKYYVSLFSDDF